MKKNLLLTVVLCLFGIVLHAQTTIAQWTFPTGVDTIDKYPDVCISLNAKMAIYAQDTTAWPKTILRSLTYTNGAATNAATAVKWQNGKDAKLWSIKLKTNKATNLTVSSKQRSGGATPGPKYWKIQAQISGQSWIDIPGGNVTCANDWTTGVVTNLPLPATFDNLTSSIYIRWIVVSDTSASGTIVDSLGISKIDDVIIKGNIPSGINENQTESEVTFFPNPNNCGVLNFESVNQVENIEIYNFQGQLLYSNASIFANKQIDINMLTPGLYIVKSQIQGSLKPSFQKLVIQ